MNVKDIYTLCLRFFANEETAKNLVHKIYLNAWNDKKKYRTDLTFSDWLHSAAIYEVIANLSSLLNEIDSNIISVNKNKLPFFDKNLFSLSNRERILFVMHDIEGFSYSEIADLFATQDVDEIRNTIYNVRSKLAEEFKR
ncbi:MAG: hypothetical protein C0425_00365 [Chlorobiaceae bacterium]|nr:hypothetical protein [Chlorobiaceae bacterium]MBA4308777.1 hypothetical protein [Chlorobiaceae bacterium]